MLCERLMQYIYPLGKKKNQIEKQVTPKNILRDIFSLFPVTSPDSFSSIFSQEKMLYENQENICF
jgi:hypothetical protein